MCLLLLFGRGTRSRLPFHLQPLASATARADQAGGGMAVTISVKNCNCCLGSLLNVSGSSERRGKCSHFIPSQNTWGHQNALGCASLASRVRCPSAEGREGPDRDEAHAVPLRFSKATPKFSLRKKTHNTPLLKHPPTTRTKTLEPPF